MPRCIIGLGSNQGDSTAIFREAVRELAARSGISLRAASSLYETEPVGGPAGQAPFLNAALLLDSDLPAESLLDVLLEIEAKLGRERKEHWGPRSLDLDLLLAGDEAISTPKLTLPHPRLMVRRFAVMPASEIATDQIVPQLGWSLGHLCDWLYLTLNIMIVVADDPRFVDDWPAEIRAPLKNWHVEFVPPSQLDGGVIAELRPRFVAVAATSFRESMIDSFREQTPWVVIDADREKGAAEVVAHSIASDTMVEPCAGPDWAQI